MKRLQKNRIELIEQYLRASKLDPELLPEILDHLACEAEERLWDGKNFEQIYHDMLADADNESLLNLSADHKSLLAMDKSLNDIVFEGRNKLYGAYDLRKSYGQTMQRSVIMGVTIFLLMVMLPNLYARLVPEPKSDAVIFVVDAAPVDIRIEDTHKARKPEPAPAQKTVRSVSPEVVRDELVKEEQVPPTVEQLNDAQPAELTADGVGDLDVVAPPAIITGSGNDAPVTLEPKKEEVFRFAEQAPEYQGGAAAMGAFFRKHLRYPSQAAKAGIKGKVFVEFTVGSDGKVENVAAVKGIGFGCDEEAVRVVKLMQNWMPGKQAGKPVKVRFTLPIAFQLN